MSINTFKVTREKLINDPSVFLVAKNMAKIVITTEVGIRILKYIALAIGSETFTQSSVNPFTTINANWSNPNRMFNTLFTLFLSRV